MTSHLTRLAVRATRPTGTLRPRSLSMFESSAPAPAVEERPTRVPASGLQATRPVFEAAAPRQPVRPAVELDRPEPVATVEASRPLGDGAPRVLPHSQVATPVSGVGKPAGPHTAARPSVPERSPAPPRRPLHAAEAAFVGPQSARRTAPQRASATGPVTTPPSIREPAPAQRATSIEPAGSSVPAAIDVPLPTSSHAARRAPDEPPVRLPQLQPLMGSDDARSTEVTVNIGRIEVVPPTRFERPPPREKPRTGPAASGAPKLTDYLRERSR